MTRRLVLRHKRRSPRSPDWRFTVTVAAIAGAAFCAALSWPFGIDPPALLSTRIPAVTQPERPPDQASVRCAVTSVTDGDTLRCRDGLRIRLHAVAAREADETCSPGHPCPTASGAAATRELRRLVLGRTLACQPIGRSYERVTAICWTASGEEINCTMVRSGTTLLWERFDRQAPICRR